MLPDPGYAAAAHAPQDVEPVTLIGALVHPTLGFPALVHAGERLEVVLWAGDGAAAPPSAALAAADFTVTLRLRRGAGAFFSPSAAGEAGRDDVVLALAAPVRALAAGAGGAWRLSAEVPLDAPALTYDLAVAGPPALLPRGEETQPLAVRVLPARAAAAPGTPDAGFDFALVADYQLWDPIGFDAVERNAGAYPPKATLDDGARAMAVQIQHELALLDPDFTLMAGDLVFGLDYRRELDDALGLWRAGHFATFFALGNHDGYASYTLDLAGAAGAVGGATGRCAAKAPTSADPVAVFAWLSCLYGDTKSVLFRELVEDGAVAWARVLGPRYYAFDHDGFRFVVLDTYDGSPERRHAIVVGLGWAGLDLGVPTVDNYGGFVGPEQLAWLARTADAAAAAGLTLVLVGHHDPRGSLADGPDTAPGDRYSADDPFPTSPLGLGPFEEWNYDGPDWDSDPGDGRGAESAARNSGTAVLEVLARHGGYYLCGHAHADAAAHYEPGHALAPGVTATRPVDVIRVTTAAAGTRGDGYRGYRLLHARDGKITRATFYDALGLGSVPAGNFWLTGRVRPGLALPTLAVTAHNALPLPLDVKLALPLPLFAPGWDARLVAPAGGAAKDGGAPAALLPLRDAAQGPSGEVMVWALSLPAAAPGAMTEAAAGKEAIVAVEVKPAAGNHPPLPKLRVLRAGVEVAAGAEAYLPSGDPVTLSAVTSTDPDGDPLWRAIWSFDDGAQAAGLEVVHAFVGAGARRVRLALTDPHGATATAELALRVSPPVVAPPGPPAATGCHCRAVTPAAPPADGMSWLVFGLVALTLGRAARAARRPRARKLQGLRR
ncbi:MAG TPA: PKD domain-containing protein [Myxococcota bacterium]|nr:PKD domain-containing protein [Myxococcota bacterium]